MPYYSSIEKEMSIFNVVGLVVVMTGGLIGGTFGVVLSTSFMGLTLGILASLFTSMVISTQPYHTYTSHNTFESYAYPDMFAHSFIFTLLLLIYMCIHR